MSAEGQATNPIGRPSDYSQELADYICSQIADGKSLRTICKPDEMPGMTSIFKWLREHKEFAEQYAKAKDDCSDALIEEALAIADDDSKDFGFKAVTNEDGESAQVFINKDNIQRDRLRVDTRKWIASKLKPKKYGEFQRQEHSGPDGKPIEHNVKGIPDAELTTRLTFLLGKIGAAIPTGGAGAPGEVQQNQEPVSGNGGAAS